MVDQNIRASVQYDEALSHTVRLEAGSEDDGIMNGNIDTPAVAIIPKMPNDEPINASTGLRRYANAMADMPPINASPGIISVSG